MGFSAADALFFPPRWCPQMNVSLRSSPSVALWLRSFARVGLSVAAVAALAVPTGCKKKNKGPSCKPDEHPMEAIRVVIQPDEMLNPNDEGEPLSVQLHVYQLSGDETIEMIDFEQVWQEGGEAAFADDYLSEEEITVNPGQPDLLELKPEADARFIVAAAIFREPLGQDWFRVWEVPRYHGHSVCAAKKKKKPWPDPCFHVMLERYSIDGGHTPPAGWDAELHELECPGAPMKNPPPEIKDEGKKKKKKKKKLKLGEKMEKAEEAEDASAPDVPGDGK